MSNIHELVLYKNRKFRSRKEKRYMTLDEIADSIQKGDIVKITHHATGADVTNEYLKGCFDYLKMDTITIHDIISKFEIDPLVRERRTLQVAKEKLAAANKKVKVASVEV